MMIRKKGIKYSGTLDLALLIIVNNQKPIYNSPTKRFHLKYGTSCISFTVGVLGFHRRIINRMLLLRHQ